MGDAPFWHSILPNLGTPEQFGQARELFTRCGFDYAGVCGRMGIEHLYRLTRTREDELAAQEPGDALDALIRLFPLSRAMDRSAAGGILGEDGIECLEALRLLVPLPDKPGQVFAPVMVHPAPSGSVLVCDRSLQPDGTKLARPAPDALYPGLFYNTIDFVARFPESPCETILDLGTGTGTAAIAWARHAQRVWATDISSRAVHFAEFNRRLAGLENISVVEGDMYEPVRGLTFDRIASHPPFVPARKSEILFRDGGEDGEQLARRVIEGLPVFLRPGGLFWGSFMISDRAGESAEQRIRRWLGESQAEFDIGFGMDSRRTIVETLTGVIADKTGTLDEVAYFSELWKDNGTEYLVHASMVIRRHAADAPPGEPITLRVQVGEGFNAGILERLLDGKVAQAQPGYVESVLDSRLSITPLCELRASHRLENGKAVTEEFTFIVEGPIRSASKVQGWMARMLVGCDGTRTVRQHFEDIRVAGQIPADADPGEFVRLVSGLAHVGLLRMDKV